MKEFISEEYRIPGTNAYNWSKYSRENIPKPKPLFKVGDMVILTTEVEIISIGKDCDSTVLYELDGMGFGWSEEQIRNLVKK